MADNDKSFPKIAESNWWKLRDLFRKKVPAVVTASYLSAALSMSVDSARGNIINPFKKIGILDESGTPTDLAYNWRDDSKYPEVCQTILEKIYPQEVRDLFHDGDIDSKSLTSWFMNHCRSGEPAAKMYAAFYKLLLKADPAAGSEPAPRKPKASEGASNSSRPQKTGKKEAVTKPEISSPQLSDEPAHHKEDKSHTRGGALPQLHINIQLHISPESTPDQIDKIFESMAKHLKDFKI